MIFKPKIIFPAKLSTEDERKKKYIFIYRFSSFISYVYIIRRIFKAILQKSESEKKSM